MVLNSRELLDDVASVVDHTDLSSDMMIVFERCGIDVVRSLMRNCAGVSFYVPAPERIVGVIEKFIVLFSAKGGILDGAGIKRLAVELGTTEKNIQNAIRRLDDRPKPSKQTSPSVPE